MINWLYKIYLDRYQKEERKKLLDEFCVKFQSQEDYIITLLKQTEFYHGTGAKHYHFGDVSKYGESEPTVLNTLEKILTEGLKPQYDLFNKTFKTDFDKTLSLTSNHRYALTYSMLYLTEGVELRYAYGSTPFWVSGIAVRLILGALRRKCSLNGLREWPTEVRLYKQMLSRWTRSFRKDGKYEGKSFSLCINGRSDISDNFGVVVGVKKGVLHPIKINYPNIAKDEIRISSSVSPKDFTHIQVPLNNIQVVKDLCDTKDIQIPIIPIEFIELYKHKVGYLRLMNSKLGLALETLPN